jgi:hypothetical protein
MIWHLVPGQISRMEKFVALTAVAAFLIFAGAAVIAAIDQHIADTVGAHVVEGDFVRAGCFDNSQNRSRRREPAGFASIIVYRK